MYEFRAELFDLSKSDSRTNFGKWQMANETLEEAEVFCTNCTFLRTEGSSRC